MGDPTVLEMIYNSLQTIEKGNAATQKCLIEQKVKVSALEIKEREIRGNQISMLKELIEHKKDRKLHYNPYNDETLREKIVRKKGEYTFLTALATFVGAVVFKILQLAGIL